MATIVTPGHRPQMATVRHKVFPTSPKRSNGARAEIVRLYETYLHHAGKTDVIAFDYREGPATSGVVHGEVFVCLPVAFEQSRQFRTNWQRELLRYAVHGVLHLGMDHQDQAQAAVMEAAERDILAGLGFPDPYGDAAGAREG